MNLSEKLSFLASVDGSDFNNPFNEDEYKIDKKEEIEEEEITLESLSVDYYLNKSKESKKKRTKKEREELFSDLDDIEVIPTSSSRVKFQKKSEIVSLIDKTDELIDKNFDDLGFEFDEYIENGGLDDDENTELKNSLISLGRKYARDTAVSAESSEISKAYSNSEKHLKTLLDELSKDKTDIQKDIEQMRLARSRNFKALSEMVEVKNQITTNQLNVIKEMNKSQKDQFDLKFKEKKATEGISENISEVSNNTIKSLFTLGKKEMISSMGGYETISGGFVSEDESGYIPEVNDDYIQSRYFREGGNEDDGDLFLKYEDRNISYILLVDEEDKPIEILAEDEDDGSLIPDYPIPNIEDMEFTIDTSTRTAEDSYHRKYKMRYI